MPSKVIIVDHDPTWAASYEAERARLLAAAAGDFAELKHIGSTAVPGLAAKPMLDLLAGFASGRAIAELATRLEPLGYEWRPRAMGDVDVAYFRRIVGDVRTHHLHVVPADLWATDARRVFRDLLRAHPDIASAYSALKRELAARHGEDRVSYTEAKTEFMRILAQHTLARAREERRLLCCGACGA